MKKRHRRCALLMVLLLLALSVPTAFAQGFESLPGVGMSHIFLPAGTSGYPLDVEFYDSELDLWDAGIMHTVLIYDVSDLSNPVQVQNGTLTVGAVGEDGIPATITAANAQAMADGGNTEYAFVIVNLSTQQPVAMSMSQLLPEIQPQSTSFGPSGDTVVVPKGETVWTHFRIFADEYQTIVGYGDPVVDTGTVSDTGTAYEADITGFTLSDGNYKLLLFDYDPAGAGDGPGAYVPFAFQDTSIISDATVFLSVYGSSSGYNSSTMATVADGHADVGVVIDDTVVTSGIYKIRYDSAIAVPSLYGWHTDLSAEPSVSTEVLEGTMRETTVTFAGNVTASGDSETLFTLRFTPEAEGTLPLHISNMFEYGTGMAESGIELMNGDTNMSIMRKEYNDTRTWFTFTDKDKAHYFFDMNSGDPLTGGVPYYVFDDQTTGPMVYTSDDFGGYFYDLYSGDRTVTGYAIDFDGYEDEGLTHGEYIHVVSEIQPIMLWADPHMLPLTDEDLTVNINETGIGLRVGQLTAQGYGLDNEWNSFAVDKTVTFAFVDDDNVAMTIAGGLSEYGDMASYNFYIYESEILQGRAYLTVDDASANQDPWDFDFSGTVDLADLAMLAQNFGIDSADDMYWDGYDLNSDGIIDLFDLVLLAKQIN